MKKPSTSENSNAVGLFPFLAVLLCTMGALLVLLVVLAQRAGQRVVSEQTQPQEVEEPIQAVVQDDSHAELADLQAQLAQVHSLQKQLDAYRQQTEKQLRDEQKKLSHLEEHARRLEHELARLSIAAEQLKATEEDQLVDQQQAENELARLQELIKDTEEQLEHLREQATGDRSYAIVPYKGPNGTYRQPIYIECCKDGVIIRPEGIRLEANDFAAPGLPGNPLAAAIRASREYLNAKAAKLGLPEPPDPYPLLLVRPDGIAQYRVARAASGSWDTDFGYEFIDGDRKLEFPELPDPQLAQVQRHAILNARDQMARLARAAPSRFRGRGFGGGPSGASGGASGTGGGYGNGGQVGDPSNFSDMAQSSDPQSKGGDRYTGGSSGGEVGADGTEFQSGSQNSGSPSGLGAEADSLATGDSQGPSLSSSGSFGEEAGNQQFAEGGGAQSESGSLAYSEGTSTQGSASGGTEGGQSSGGPTAGGQSAAPTAGGPNMSVPATNIQSIAQSQGKNWAVSKGSSRSVPIRRPIQVVVRNDRLALLPSRHETDGVGATGTVIALNQPLSKVSDEFVEALQTRIQQWGLAGNGLYWRPVLQLNVAPDAVKTAYGLSRLLQDSGVEIDIPESNQSETPVQAVKGDRVNATR